jgi:hypothetical protein
MYAKKKGPAQSKEFHTDDNRPMHLLTGFWEVCRASGQNSVTQNTSSREG